jgi:hypothetical protein
MGMSAVDLPALTAKLERARGRRGGAVTVEVEELAELIDALETAHEALRAVLSNLEYRESDGWMSGHVHGDDAEAARAALAQVEGVGER